MNDDDRYRFLHDLWEFNDINVVAPFIRRTSKTVGFLEPNGVLRTQKSREKIVEIICFCLMPNHFHLLLKQNIDNGISLFMTKLGAGYANYFNTKYERTGSLFEGTFKAKHIDNDAYLTHLTKYIHLNPVDLVEPDWQEKGLKDARAAREFLKDYKWSSFKDYIGIKNYPSLIEKKLIMDMIGGEAGYKRFAIGALSADFDAVKEYIIE
ncbi:MAG: transposase [Patescibacteria group bacterium]